MPTVIVSVGVVVEIVGICFRMSVDVALATLREGGLTLFLRIRMKICVLSLCKPSCRTRDWVREGIVTRIEIGTVALTLLYTQTSVGR